METQAEATQEGPHHEDGAFKEESPLRETRAELLARHQKEKKELQNREIGLKKAAAKGSKAEQKAKKKQVEEEIAKLEAKMKARHAKELSSSGDPAGEHAAVGLDGVMKSLNGVFTAAESSQPPKPTKAQKRRDRRAQQEAEREQKIRDEQSNVVSSRVLENQQLERKLRPRGLTLREIKPDGHCLYRAVEDQLSLYPRACQQASFQELREVAAAYIRSHSEDFMPFIVADGEEEDEAESQKARFDRYCAEVESTAAWGGQVELDAIARSLRKHIVVFSADLPDVEMGKEYESVSASTGSNPSLRLSYHRHAFGLGEHYNSVVPVVSDASPPA